MTPAGLLGAFAEVPGCAALARAALRPAAEDLRVTAATALRPFLIGHVASAMAEEAVCLAVTATAREAEDLAWAVTDLLGPGSAAEFPAWETLPHERLSPSADTVGRRLEVLRRIAQGPRLRVVVAPVRALLQPLAPGLGLIPVLHLVPGDTVDLDDAMRLLVEYGYARTDLVEKRGQFAVRGGILDVFPPGEEHPVRVELWGDTVEEVRAFAVSDQRSVGLAEQGLRAGPVREILLTDAVRARAADLASSHPELGDVVSRIAEGIAVEGMEALAPVLVDAMEPLTAVLPEGSLVLACDPERVAARAGELVQTSREFLEASWHSAAMGAQAPLATLDLSAAAYADLRDVEAAARARGLGWWDTGPFAREDPGAVVLEAAAIEDFRGDLAAAAGTMRSWLAESDAVVLVAEGHGSAERLGQYFRDEGLPVAAGAPEPAASVVPRAGAITVATGRIPDGFASRPAHLVVVTEMDLLGQRGEVRDMARMPSRRRNAIDPLALVAGDYVVHDQHGVGRYVDMIERTVAGATREYVVLEYAPSKRGQPPDRLYVPTDQLDQVTRYIGGEAPSLHRLGGTDWQRTKGRARRAVREIAGELIRLYAARQAAPGHSFGPDTEWQRELEDAFPYVETPDQMASIDEVKADMQRAVPMDRVICGDVGYGKTEIAVRAAFKAVQDGKQVAILVPTTLLVQQHLSTFSARYAPFPVRVAALSRFNSDAEVRETLKGIEEGTVDVVIGTHRLLTPAVRFRDLGLVIVDEEQRFGVEHKEHLKALRTAVDVLTMSATPIPRTLEMSLTGIRDLSTIQTPPEERHPILTFVGPYDDRQVAAAIRRELIRDGQVFFVHNRVESIERVAARLRDLVPEARIAVAHGQMNEHALERVVVDFWERRVDVLVCTTIVENGIDIANANTLIVDRADLLGLSQLHQLRGRVGRGRERGYAYFLYPPESALSETAYDRLATIAQHADLGSGMQIALKDLEIRGAGNLLGGDQSGHIAEVGFDLYVRLVGEALAEARGESETVAEAKVELPVNAYIPHEYVPEERLRLEAYRRLAAAATHAEVSAVEAELLDRYGPVPEPVAALLAVARFRCRARSLGLEEVVGLGPRIRFSPVELPESRALRLARVYPGTVIKPAVRTILVPRPTTARVGGEPLRDRELLEWADSVLDVLEPTSGSAT